MGLFKSLSAKTRMRKYTLKYWEKFLGIKLYDVCDDNGITEDTVLDEDSILGIASKYGIERIVDYEKISNGDAKVLFSDEERYQRYEILYDEWDERIFEDNAKKNNYSYRLTTKDRRRITISLKGGNIGDKEYLIKMQLQDGKMIAGSVHGDIDLRKIYAKDKKYMDFLADEYFETKSMITAMQDFGGFIGSVRIQDGKYLIEDDLKSKYEGQNSIVYANFNEINFDEHGQIISVIDSKNNEEDKISKENKADEESKTKMAIYIPRHAKKQDLEQFGISKDDINELYKKDDNETTLIDHMRKNRVSSIEKGRNSFKSKRKENDDMDR